MAAYFRYVKSRTFEVAVIRLGVGDNIGNDTHRAKSVNNYYWSARKKGEVNTQFFLYCFWFVS
jgi:hypothetical protein